MQAQAWPDDWRQSGTEKQRTIIYTEFTFRTNRLMKPPEIHLQRERHHVKVKRETSSVKYASNPKQDKAVEESTNIPSNHLEVALAGS